MPKDEPRGEPAAPLAPAELENLNTFGVRLRDGEVMCVPDACIPPTAPPIELDRSAFMVIKGSPNNSERIRLFIMF